MAVLRYGEKEPIANIVEDDCPIPRTEYRKIYLAPDHRLSSTLPSTLQTVSYIAEDSQAFASFSYTFTETTHLIGIPKAVLHMSCESLDDMDVFVVLRKISSTGEEMLNLNVPLKGLPISSIAEIPADKRTEVILYKGPTGQLRASHRAICPSKSIHENWPYYKHDREIGVPPGQIVKLEIGIWAMGVEFEAGESIELQISGHAGGIDNFGTGKHARNKGTHVIHISSEHDSHVILPFVSIQ